MIGCIRSISGTEKLLIAAYCIDSSRLKSQVEDTENQISKHTTILSESHKTSTLDEDIKKGDEISKFDESSILEDMLEMDESSKVEETVKLNETSQLDNVSEVEEISKCDCRRVEEISRFAEDTVHEENPALTISFVYTTQSCSWKKNHLNTAE